MAHQTFFKSDLPTRYEAKKEAVSAEEARWTDVRKAVDARDQKRCRCCGRSHLNPDRVGVLHKAHRHHITYRSAGGEHSSANVITLCASCHNSEHKHNLRIEGNADEGVTIWRKDDAGDWFISRQESAPHVVIRD